MRKGRIKAGATAILLALAPAAAGAQDNRVANTAVPADPAPEPEPEPAPEPTPRDTRPPAPQPSEPIVTTVPVSPPPVTTVEPFPDAAGNPYANAYNELLPLEEEEEEGFDWGLLGLIGLLGLLGLARRRERLVYVERGDRVVPAAHPRDTRPNDTLQP